MGLLDQVLGSVLGQTGDAGQPAGNAGQPAQAGSGGMQAMLVQAVLGMLTNQQSGGLGGLADKFRQAGLGDKVNSWIGTGQNQPVSGEEVHQALGSEQIAAIAQKVGIAPEMASNMLAQVLPKIVDHATPAGEVPEHSVLEQGMEILKGRLGAS